MSTTTKPGIADDEGNNRRRVPPPAALWHASAPAALVQYNDLSAGTPGWTAWSRHLERRKLKLPKLLRRAEQSPLAWGLSGELASALDGAPPTAGLPSTRHLLSGMHRALNQRSAARCTELGETLGQWLAEAQAAPPSPRLALEAIGWSHVLPMLAAQAPAELWWDALDQLVQLSSAAPDLLADPCTQQLLAVELPIALAWSLPELARTAALAEPAVKKLQEAFAELLDGRGALHGRYLAQLRPLLACWTRAKALLDDRLPQALDKEDGDQYQRVVRVAVRFSRPDGSAVFSAVAAEPADRELLSAAAKLAGNHKTRSAAEQLLRAGKRKHGSSGKSRRRAKNLPSAAGQSEWSEVAVLQARFSGLPARLAINYSDRRLQTELSSQGVPLLIGQWQLAASFNGQPLHQEGDWEDVCWNSDDDCDYLELQAEFSGGVRIQRQMLLARDDRFLLLCDALLGTQTGQWQYELRLPLAEAVRLEPAAETREVYLSHGGQRRALALPLALPEWRVDPRHGTLQGEEGALVLAQHAKQAGAMFAPLLVDLDTRRLKRQFTWRRLTVVKDRATERPDAAVGYRVQLGKRQWLIYRSLANQGNRTLLGHNLISEFLVARFDEGQVDTLIEIE